MESADIIRVGSYLSALRVMAVWELIAPRRPLTVSKLCRWGGNLTIVILNTAIARLFFMGDVVAISAMAQERGWGLLNWVDGPGWFVVTPDMHRIRHSVDVRETNSNYGLMCPGGIGSLGPIAQSRRWGSLE